MFEETLILKLGPAIAKSILKWWLKGAIDAGESFGSDIIDILKSKTDDVLAQQRAKRQLEAIGEKAAESLLVLFEAEGAQLDEGEKNAVTLAVSETLEKSQIDTAWIATNNLEPTLLAEHLFKSNPEVTRDFSEPGRSLYKRIIDETSQLIIDIASQLPNFTERTFAEILKREDNLIKVAEQILAEVKQLRRANTGSDVEAARFDEDYRRAVIRRLDELQLFGVDINTTANKRHRLSVAYVTLSVEQSGGTISKRELPIFPDEKLEISSDEQEEITETISVEAFLSESKRLLILGDAGSGKTTLLQWIAVRSAQRDFNEHLAEWNNTTPFFVRLREFADSQLPSPEYFPKTVASAISATMPAQWVHHQLKSGEAIVLIDGVDEIRETRREEIRIWLRDLVESFPDARFIVSSRPHAVENKWLQEMEFADAELLPMEMPQIREFIDHWHNAVREALQDENEKNELESLAEDLKNIIKKQSRIRKLVTNPLLCAMVCALHRDRQRQLPSDRIELYKACIQMLIDRRDIERKVDLRAYPQLTYRQKLDLLQDLAYWIFKNESSYSMMDVQRVDQRLSQKLKNMIGLDYTRGESVRRLFVERSGLVREPVKGKIDFTHRTFQEFLAAQAALEENDLGLLVTNSSEEKWREVIIMAAGLARQQERAEIIGELIKKGDAEPRNKYQLHLLAVACLETSINLDKTIKDEVTKRLKKLIPPKNMTEAKALASAGELAVSHLVWNRQRRGNEAAAGIRTLALISGDAGFEAIKTYKDDERQAVKLELLRAWDYFDRVEYAQQILIKNRSLKLEKVTSLEGLKETGIEELSIYDYNYSWREVIIPNINTLKSLTLYGIALTRKSFSEYMPQLRELSLRYSFNVDLINWLNLNELEELKIDSQFSNAIDWVAMGNLTKLKSLIISDNYLLIDLNPLSSLNELTSIVLHNCPNIKDFSPLANLPKLEHFTCNSISHNAVMPEKLKAMNQFGKR